MQRRNFGQRRFSTRRLNRPSRLKSRAFSNAKKEVSVQKTIFKYTGYLALTPAKQNVTGDTGYGGADMGCIGLLLDDDRWTLFKQQFDEFRVAGIKYNFCISPKTTGVITRAVTAFDRGAGFTDSLDKYLVISEHPTANAITRFKNIISNPSVKEVWATASQPGNVSLMITPANPSEKLWTPTTQFKAKSATAGESLTYLPGSAQAFNPKIMLSIQNIVSKTEEVNIGIGCEIYIETRGQKMYTTGQ